MQKRTVRQKIAVHTQRGHARFIQMCAGFVRHTVIVSEINIARKVQKRLSRQHTVVYTLQEIRVRAIVRVRLSLPLYRETSGEKIYGEGHLQVT
jgi:hypothetical protein